MHQRDSIGVRGEVRIKVRRHGEMVREIVSRNMVVNGGLDLLADLFIGATTTIPRALAVGTGTTAPTKADTALEAEVYRSPQLTEYSRGGTGAAIFKYYLTASQANGNTLTEAGLFTSNSGGTMVARVTHTAITKTSAESVTYEWTITLS